MEIKPQYWRKKAISHDPKDIEDPANKAYINVCPDGTKFINWYNPSPISYDPEDINNPANAQYLYEAPDGTKYVDWNNPGHKLENWVERINLLVSGDLEKIWDHYEQLYYDRLARRQGLGPKRETSDNPDL